MDPERLEDRLARLEEERREADRLYNERLTAVDRALLRAPEFPHVPPPYDETQITPINQSWQILPEQPPAVDGSLKGRLRGFIWRLVGPSLGAQQAFNAALVDHLNRNVAAHREAQRALASTIALIQGQSTSLLHLQAALMGLLQSLTLYVDTKDRSVGGQIQVLNGALSALTDDWMKHWESQRLHEARRDAQHPALVQAYDDLSGKVALAQQTALLLKREVERLLARGAGAAQAAPEAGAPGQPPNRPDSLDAFRYVGFEDRFRGSQDTIRRQLADYVPLFAGASAVLDIGCGRGELLDLLREAGIGAHGVDVNASMVEICRERGLSADVAGAVEYLDQQPDRSLDGIIAIQVVEHLEPAYLTRLLDVACHKLKPGAPLVLETINPACWVAFFESYLRDVTHRWPLHPETLRYLTQASGFSTVDVQLRAPVAAADRLEHVPPPDRQPGQDLDPALVDLVDVVNAHADKLNARLFTFMDYAIVARK